MEQQNIEVRKIGLKTYIYMGIIVVLGIIFYILVQDGRSAKATKLLKELGYEHVDSVKVYSIKDFENIDTKIQGKQYFVKFKDLDSNKFCKGFIIKDFKHNVDQDLTCTKDEK